MLKINNKPYLNLDPFLPLETMPDVKELIIESYDILRFSNPFTQFDNVGKVKEKHPITSDVTHKDTWTREIRTGVCSAPYIFLFLREGKKSNNVHGYSWIYDSILDSDDIWDSWKWIDGLSEKWNPFINWIESLPLKKISNLIFFLQKPYIIPYFHQDHLLDGNSYPHRQEFIRIEISDKSFQILNLSNEPIDVKHKAIFFNQQTLHGSNKISKEWTISLRIDCVFTEELRKKLGIHHLEQY